MELILPAGTTSRAFDAALAAFAGVVGKAWVFASDLDRDTYLDSYALGDGHDHAASAAVAPANAEEAQAIVRLANEHRVPLWPVSRGKNLGYGHGAPLIPGTVVLDLGRMNRILEIDEKLAYCVIEPGVGFFQLYDHLKDNGIKLWMSVPGNAWGSVIGNALERGLGYTAYGDHSEQLCGMEVVMPDGDMLRTGFGAMDGGKAWHHYKYGYGPSWDQMFVQSNFGVVTKAGLWLQPEPAMSAKTAVTLPRFEDLGWAIDRVAELRRQDVIRHNFVFGNYLHDAAVLTQRSDWYTGQAAIPDDVSQRIIDKYGSGWWSFRLNVTGRPGSVESDMQAIRETLEPWLDYKLEFETWRPGDPLEKSARGIPSVRALQIVNWYGGRGGHVGFSPVMPQDGEQALAQARRMKARFEEYGLDYYTSFTMGRRHISNVNLILYNRDNADMVSRAKGLFNTLIADSAAHGYGEYRTHLDFMEPVAKSYGFNDHALFRFNERIKRALDPNNVIAPGKYGIGSLAGGRPA